LETKRKKRVLVIGAGGHGMVVADILMRMSDTGASVEPIGFMDDNPIRQATMVLGLPVLGPLAKLPEIPHDAIILAIGDNATRKRLYLQLRQAGESTCNAIHPMAILAPSARIGTGNVICVRAVVGVNAVVGDNVILNTNSVVDHESIVEDHAHVSGSAGMAGNVHIGEGAFVGAGATILPGIHIGAWSIVGGGAVAHRDIPERVTLVGMPGRIVEAAREERG
jgi:sugar O-acyltransferase (sialic acid O-acetyltransferase NeuD family)